jgi:hypothetical protein
MAQKRRDKEEEERSGERTKFTQIRVDFECVLSGREALPTALQANEGV